MNRRTFGIIGLCVVASFVILVIALPVSGLRGSGPQDGTGNQYGGPEYQNCAGQNGTHAGNGTCILADCPNNGTPKCDGTGSQFGRCGKGQGNGGQSGRCGQGCGRQVQI